MSGSNYFLDDGLGVESGQDDSPFLSAADFFSLLSLTLLYVSIVFVPQVPVPANEIPVRTGIILHDHTKVVADPAVAYIQLRPSVDGVQLIVIRPGKRAIRPVDLTTAESDVGVAVNWLDTNINVGARPRRLVFSMAAQEVSGDLHRFFNQVTQKMSDRYVVSISYMIDKPGSP